VEGYEVSDLDKLLQQLQRAGWRVTKTRGGHWKVWSPDGKAAVVTSGTPGDRRALANFRAQLKRAGYKPPVGRPRKPKAPAAAPPLPTPTPAPAAAPAPSAGPSELDLDLQALAGVLDALVAFEGLVRKYRAKLEKLAELEQVLK
jgi:predicted RNA binding protein YcfA (HicA-like mRNA interferase family)